MDFREALSIELLRGCRLRGLSLPALAKAADVPLSTLKNIVGGNSANPGILTLAALCRGLQIDLAEFVAAAEKTAALSRISPE